MSVRVYLLFFSLILSIASFGQKKTEWVIDVFPLDLSTNVLFKLNSGFSLGLEGEVGYNFSNYILSAGSHFSDKFTLIPYQNRDEYGNEGYGGLLGIGVFTRIREEKEIPLDLGVRTELFVHSDDSDDDLGTGVFYGTYIKAFKTIKHKNLGDRKVKKISIGARASIGIFSEYSLIEFGFLTDFWLRFHL